MKMKTIINVSVHKNQALKQNVPHVISKICLIYSVDTLCGKNYYTCLKLKFNVGDSFYFI